MSEVGPAIDRPPSPSAGPLSLATPTLPHDQPITPQSTPSPSPTADGSLLEFPSPSYAVPERTTAHRPEPPITALSPPQPLTGIQVQTPPLLPHAIPEDPLEGSPLQHHTTRARLLAFFGFGSGPELRERKEFMSLIWNLGFNGAQVGLSVLVIKAFQLANCLEITAIVALLIYSSEHPSPEFPDVSEWRACNKPLGLWNSIWAVKVGFDCIILFWGYKRERIARTMNACVSFSTNLFCRSS